SAFQVQLPGERFLILSDPQAVAAVLAYKPEQVHAHKAPRFLDFLGSSSMILASGAQHQRVRRSVSGALTAAKVATYRGLILELTDQMIDEWPLDTPFLLHQKMQELTMRISLRMIFGGENRALLSTLHHCFTESLRVLVQPWALMPLGLQNCLGS